MTSGVLSIIKKHNVLFYYFKRSCR